MHLTEPDGGPNKKHVMEPDKGQNPSYGTQQRPKHTDGTRQVLSVAFGPLLGSVRSGWPSIGFHQ